MPSPFGSWLRGERAKAKLSMMQLESRTAITYAHISKIETGRARPSRETVMKLAAALGADMDCALMRAGFLPFGAPHLQDPETLQVARTYYELPPNLQALVRTTLELALQAADRDRKAQP